MQKVVNLLQKYASGKNVLMCAFVTLLILLVMLLYTMPAAMRFATGDDLTLFDLTFTGYSYEYALRLLQAMGVEGRGVYLHMQLPVDFVFPGLLAVSTALLLTWVLGKGYAPDAKVFYFTVLPFLCGLFDYLENISIVQMIHSYPNISNVVVNNSSTFTQLKTCFAAMAFLLLLIGIFRAVRNSVAIARSQS